MRDYALFVLGATCAMGWFLGDNFGFLDVKVGTQGVEMRTLCKLITTSFALNTLLPGLMLTANARGGGGGGGGGGRWVMGLAAAVQGVVFVAVERAMVLGAATSRYDEGDLAYPPYLVLATSVVGWACAGKDM